ncbi:hypothetical protein OF83DRAFT_416216 [Amylostereum chailletii]|nr:hypothetical protein OF83DRAFT_416216 [Amylostereum chailletii]
MASSNSSNNSTSMHNPTRSTSNAAAAAWQRRCCSTPELYPVRAPDALTTTTTTADQETTDPHPRTRCILISLPVCCPNAHPAPCLAFLRSPFACAVPHLSVLLSITCSLSLPPSLTPFRSPSGRAPLFIFFLLSQPLQTSYSLSIFTHPFHRRCPAIVRTARLPLLTLCHPFSAFFLINRDPRPGSLSPYLYSTVFIPVAHSTNPPSLPSPSVPRTFFLLLSRRSALACSRYMSCTDPGLYHPQLEHVPRRLPASVVL